MYVTHYVTCKLFYVYAQKYINKIKSNQFSIELDIIVQNTRI